MSEQVTAAKKKSPSVGHLVFVLFLISAIAALCLGLVNYITADKIVAINQKNTEAAMAEVLQADSYTKVDYTGDSILEGDVTIEAVYKAGDAGYVIQDAPQGFSGAVSMVVGVNSDGTISGVSIIKHSETSGLGSNAAKPAFKDQYTKPDNMNPDGTFSVNKDGGKIQALTGATITSRAVTRGVNAALQVLATMN